MADRRYPLHWPEGWPRTPASRRKSSAYKVSETKAREELLHSLHLMGANGVILSTNVRLRQDGLPYANQRIPDDPGVAVYWTRKGQEQVMACDTYRTIRENYRAVGLALDALRQLERCGASQILDRAFTGFAALPETSGAPSWRVELGLEREDVTAEDVMAAFRRKVQTAHPDRGGSEEAFRRLIAARDAALLEVAHHG